MKYQNIILTLHFILQDETYERVKCDVNVRIKIKKPCLFHVWLFGVDLKMCKLNKVQSYSLCSQILRQNTLLEWQDTQW